MNSVSDPDRAYTALAIVALVFALLVGSGLALYQAVEWAEKSKHKWWR